MKWPWTTGSTTTGTTGGSVPFDIQTTSGTSDQWVISPYTAGGEYQKALQAQMEQYQKQLPQWQSTQWQEVDSLDHKLKEILDKQPTDLAAYVLQAKAHLIKAIKILDESLTKFSNGPATVGNFTEFSQAMKNLQTLLEESVKRGQEEVK